MAGQARILTPDDIKAVFKLLDPGRDQLLFALGIYTGLRISEIVGLKVEQVWTEQGNVRHVLTVRRSKKKGTTYSDISIHPKLRKVLQGYGRPGGVWLFPSERSGSGHLERVQAHNVLRAVFDRLGLDGASTHSMRRTCLTNMSRAGVPLRTIQKISGHSSLSALQVYLAVDPDDVAKAIKTLRY